MIQKSEAFFKKCEPGEIEEVKSDKFSQFKCYICYDKEPNTINIPCLHGGQCKGCAKRSFGFSNECPHCKQKIEKIVVYKKVAKPLNLPTEDGKPSVTPKNQVS